MNLEFRVKKRGVGGLKVLNFDPGILSIHCTLNATALHSQAPRNGDWSFGVFPLNPALINALLSMQRC